MKQYKYSLDNSSKKFLCPKCNKKTFVKYIDSKTGHYLNEDFGRCDRETNCGFYSTPKGIFKNTFEIVNIPTPKPSFHNYGLVVESGRNFKQNNFIQFLKTIFSNDEVKKAITKYLIGTSKFWNGATIFWQIDNKENVRHGKIMLYNKETGKRIKGNNGKALINSVRTILKLKSFNLKQCLFGLHLVNETNTKTIALVESEKTAIIMSLFKPNYIWLATGGLTFFSYEYLKPIKDFKIIAFPDKSEYNKWLNIAIELNALGFKIVVNDWIENQNFEVGTDLADVYIHESKNINAKVLGNYTKIEQEVYEIEQHTPEIRKLIETFDLTDYYGNEIRKIN